MSFNIGEAAKASGVSTKMIRYYESIGLIAAVHRSESGYRVYSDADVRTLLFIRRARDLGFLAEDIAGLLDLWRNRDRTSAEVKQLVQHHIGVLSAKIEALDAMRQTLERLVCNCPGNERPECPILNDLSDVGESVEAPSVSKIRAPGGVLSGKGKTVRTASRPASRH